MSIRVGLGGGYLKLTYSKKLPILGGGVAVGLGGGGSYPLKPYAKKPCRWYLWTIKMAFRDYDGISRLRGAPFSYAFDSFIRTYTKYVEEGYLYC